MSTTTTTTMHDPNLTKPHNPSPPKHPPRRPRIICYHQTIHHAGEFISMLPLLTEETGVTHVILAAIHLNSPTHITLNDDPYRADKFTELWDEARILQAHGIKVMGMLGGAARGSFLRLDGDAAAFEAFYQPLREMVLWACLDGLDLDVEEAMSLGGVIRLVDRLRHDFGQEFIITLAPVAPGMRGGQNLHGFDLEVLEKGLGRHISWYNTQFYCGWGNMGACDDYEGILRRGWPAEKIVVGLVTNPGNGAGWVPDETLKIVLKTLIKKYPKFGGVMGWEYFNSITSREPIAGRPWIWAQFIKEIFDEALGEKEKAPKPV
jgi:chitinase